MAEGKDDIHRVYSSAIATLREEEILEVKEFCHFSLVLQSNREQICKQMLTPERSRISLNDSSVSVHILNNNVVKIGEISNKKRTLIKMERVLDRKSLVEGIVCMRKRVKGYRIMKKM